MALASPTARRLLGGAQPGHEGGDSLPCTELAPSGDDELARLDPELERARERAKALFEAGGSANTSRAYLQDWRRFAKWCERHAKVSMPASEGTLADYVAHLVDDRRPKAQHERGGVCRRSTVKRALASIVARHRADGIDSPMTPRLREYVRRICCALATRITEAPPLMVNHLHATIACMQASVDDPVTVRDRAVLLLGWGGALRRGEIAGLDLSDVQFGVDGLRLSLRRSKADTAGDGTEVGVLRAVNAALCPVEGLRAWLAIRGELDGPLFYRTWWGKLAPRRLPDRAVNSIVQRWTHAAGIEPEKAGVRFTAHSLRAGFISAAVVAGKPESRVMRHTRHSDFNTFARYVRAEPFVQHPALGLL